MLNKNIKKSKYAKIMFYLIIPASKATFATITLTVLIRFG
jgi:hypothetical protein